MSDVIDSHHAEGVDGTGDEQRTERISKSHLFELLSADRRQEVLRYLDANGGGATLGELAEHIASLECDCEVTDLSSQQRKRVYVGLYQCHLPKMAEAGVIDYDQDRGDVTLNERSPRLLQYLYLEESRTTEQRSSLLERFLR
jgi:hypothetical protein